MNRQTESKSEKRDQILSAALSAFAEHGFYNTRISEIAEKANVADGTIYLYFKNKDDLLISLFEDRMDWIIDRIERELASLDATPAEQLRHLMARHLELANEKPELAEFITVELRQSAKFVKEYKNDRFYKYLGVIEQIIEEGQQAGLIRDNLDSRIAARTIFGALDEALLALTLSDSDGGELERRTDEFVKTFMQGLLSPAGRSARD